MNRATAPARHLLVTHRNWWLLHVAYIIVLIVTFVMWGVIGAMYFATTIETPWLADLLFLLYAGFIISLPGWWIHVRAAKTYPKPWRWIWSASAQLLYYVIAIVVMLIVMLCISYV
ncbi:hypothetical protein [Caryophanon tenue]|uniref:Uncharacterized protein n=1 Tax=Caryophanon tenue TaxID=33978 RepID=A0A1C0YND5_9BACL|nr:hypothetical protein [Caryophanon tenue]OCS88579.1 hypothetical protein A6M13_01665 [Caryophanon tenue]